MCITEDILVKDHMMVDHVDHKARQLMSHQKTKAHPKTKQG
jgi:hypothetical protein